MAYIHQSDGNHFQQSTHKSGIPILNFKLKKPCKNCPFRSDLPAHLKGWLGKPRSEQIALDVLKRGANFACHKTTTHSNDGDENRSGYLYTEKESPCAGAAIMQIKADNPSQWMQVSERLGFDTGVKDLDLDSPVFENPEQFIEFHSL